MERELEVKILGLDISLIQDKIMKLGAKKIGEENQVNITINSSKHPITKEIGYLRLRKTIKNNKESFYLTFKEQVVAQGIRDSLEHTTKVSNPEELLSILQLLGYDELDYGEKKRISYEWMGARFDFDTWDKDTYPEPYLEIEVRDAVELNEILEKLEIDREHVSTKSIAELKKEWKLIIS